MKVSLEVAVATGAALGYIVANVISLKKTKESSPVPAAGSTSVSSSAPSPPAHLEPKAAAVVGASMALAKFFEGLLTSSCIYVGDKLGLYKVLLKGNVSSAALAQQTGLDERFLLEWLLQGSAVGVLTYDSKADTFSISPGFDVLLFDTEDDGNGNNMSDGGQLDSAINDLRLRLGNMSIGIFQMGPGLVSRFANLEQCFRSGLGANFDQGELAADIGRGLDRLNALTFSSGVPKYVFTSDTVTVRGVQLATALLKGGLTCCDVGCGSGQAIIQMAKQFPKNTFHGFDISKEALAIARKKVGADPTLKNVTFYYAKDYPVDSTAAKYDMAFSHDCIHDCTQPAQVLAQIKRALKPDCPLVIVDIKCASDKAGNVVKPGAGIYFGLSLSLCLQSSLSEKGGCGLGNLGLSTERCFKFLKEAGFKSYFNFETPALPQNNIFVAY